MAIPVLFAACCHVRLPEFCGSAQHSSLIAVLRPATFPFYSIESSSQNCFVVCSPPI